MTAPKEKLRCCTIPGTPRIPTLPTYPVANARPSHAVLATRSVGVGDLAAAIGPEVVELTVVNAGLARSYLAFGQAIRRRKGSDGGCNRKQK